MSKFKTGQCVWIKGDLQLYRSGQIGFVSELADDDTVWVHFPDGSEAPYGAAELALVPRRILSAYRDGLAKCLKLSGGDT